MLSSLLTAAAMTAASLLPLPLPLPFPLPEPLAPPTSSPTTAPGAQGVDVSGALDAPDGRLKRGCKDYAYAYSVTTETDDWTFDITLQDRAGKGVNAQSLLGPNDDTSGVLTYRLCRGATKPGRFTLTGDLTAYEGSSRETHVAVSETFRLRAKNR